MQNDSLENPPAETDEPINIIKKNEVTFGGQSILPASKRQTTGILKNSKPNDLGESKKR